LFTELFKTKENSSDKIEMIMDLFLNKKFIQNAFSNLTIDSNNNNSVCNNLVFKLLEDSNKDSDESDYKALLKSIEALIECKLLAIDMVKQILNYFTKEGIIFFISFVVRY